MCFGSLLDQVPPISDNPGGAKGKSSGVPHLWGSTNVLPLSPLPAIWSPSKCQGRPHTVSPGTPKPYRNLQSTSSYWFSSENLKYCLRELWSSEGFPETQGSHVRLQYKGELSLQRRMWHVAVPKKQLPLFPLCQCGGGKETRDGHNGWRGRRGQDGAE